MPDEKQLLIEVRDKIAKVKSKNFNLVGGNSDYNVVFDFDEDWENVNPKTAVFVFGKEEPIYSVFDGNTCKGVAINGASMCLIGVFAGDIKTTTPAMVECVYRSILDEANGTPQPPTEDVYNQIMGLLDKWLEYANDAATKKFVMDKVLPLTQATNSQNKRIKNLESRLPIGAFVEDSEIAYIKTVPTNACPYAQINKIGGRTYKCNNLLKYPYYMTTKQHKGIKFVDNGDGSITINGMNDGTGMSAFHLFHIDNKPLYLKAGTYTVFDTGNSNIAIAIVDKNNTHYKGTFQLSNDTEVGVSIRIPTGNTTNFDNVTVYPMLNRGSTALPYEPYWEGTRDTKVTALESKGFNLLNPADFKEIVSSNISINKEDGALIVNGKDTNNRPYGTSSFAYFYLDKGTYTLSAKEKLPSNLIIRVGKGVDGAVMGEITNKNSFTFEWTEEASKECLRMWFYLYAPFSYDNQLIYLMVNKGNMALPYSPYGFNDTFTIPEAIQAIEGYGQSNPDNPDEYNYIDFERKMFVAYGHMVDDNWVAYAEPIKTDISSYLSNDNFIEVRGGVSITAINNNESKVPSTITYLMKTEAE